MKVLLLNGSAHEHGTTFNALSMVEEQLHKCNVETVLFQLGKNMVHGCIGCGYCRQHGNCVFQDDILPQLVAAIKEVDAIIIGSPVYYAGPSGALCAILDRLFFSAASILRGKPGAAIAVCRRAGATATIDRLNKYFTINQMPVVSSKYWNVCIARTPEDLVNDPEGSEIMRTLGDNMAKMLSNRKI